MVQRTIYWGCSTPGCNYIRLFQAGDPQFTKLDCPACGTTRALVLCSDGVTEAGNHVCNDACRAAGVHQDDLAAGRVVKPTLGVMGDLPEPDAATDGAA